MCWLSLFHAAMSCVGLPIKAFEGAGAAACPCTMQPVHHAARAPPETNALCCFPTTVAQFADEYGLKRLDMEQVADALIMVGCPPLLAAVIAAAVDCC